jgi:hypothetical protein
MRSPFYYYNIAEPEDQEMKTNRTVGTRLRALFVSLVLGAAPALAQAPAAREKPAAVKPVAATAETQPAAKPSGGMSEGIQVHGEWTIVVRNEDGSIAARYEFHNALVNLSVLPTLLNRQGSTGGWAIFLIGPTPTEQPCVRGGGIITIAQQCVLLEVVDGFSPIGAVGGLGVSVDNNALVLMGSMRAQNPSHIAIVVTAFTVCGPSQAPSSTCTTSDHLQNFTQKDISSMNIQVNAKQTMDVTVRISFS